MGGARGGIAPPVAGGNAELSRVEGNNRFQVIPEQGYLCGNCKIDINKRFQKYVIAKRAIHEPKKPISLRSPLWQSAPGSILETKDQQERVNNHMNMKYISEKRLNH